MPAQSAVGVGTSRALSSRPARRQPLKARLSLSAPSGAGKTWTGLQIATELAQGGIIEVVDTEATTEDVASSETYADAFTFNVTNWQRSWGYDPRDLIATLWDFARRGVETPAVVMIDSASHFWRGAGGTLDIADGRFTGWKGARPVQDSLVECILQMPFHVIVCTRAKMQHAVDESSGRQVVTKLGMGAIQSDDLEYEMQVCLVLDMEHRIDVSKTRATVLAGKSWQANHEVEFAALYRQWLDKGESVIRQADADALVSTALAAPDADRAAYREAFKAQWGSPSFLTPDQLDAVWAWVYAAIPVEPHPFRPVSDDQPDRCATCNGGRSRCRWHYSTAPDSIEAAATGPTAPVEASEAPASPNGAHPGPETPTEPQDAPGEEGMSAAEARSADAQDAAAEVAKLAPAPIHRPDRDSEVRVDRPSPGPEPCPEDEQELEQQLVEMVRGYTPARVKKELGILRVPFKAADNDATLRLRLTRTLVISALGRDPYSTPAP